MIDVNVHLSRWPFRRLRGDDPASLCSILKNGGVEQAWVGSLDSLLHRDVEGVNRRLTAACREHGDGFLVPFGSVNPMLPDWEEDLRRCQEEHRMPGIRLYPNYHQYTLTEPALASLLDQASARGMVVQIVAAMEDTRTQHPLVQVPVVDLMPLERLLPKLPSLRLCVLNGLGALGVDQCQRLLAVGNIHFDIAMLEGAGGVRRFLDQVPARQLLFGSHFPLFYLESSRLKMEESEVATPERQAILRDNARRLLGQTA